MADDRERGSGTSIPEDENTAFTQTVSEESVSSSQENDGNDGNDGDDTDSVPGEDAEQHRGIPEADPADDEVISERLGRIFESSGMLEEPPDDGIDEVHVSRPPEGDPRLDPEVEDRLERLLDVSAQDVDLDVLQDTETAASKNISDISELEAEEDEVPEMGDGDGSQDTDDMEELDIEELDIEDIEEIEEVEELEETEGTEEPSAASEQGPEQHRTGRRPPPPPRPPRPAPRSVPRFLPEHEVPAPSPDALEEFAAHPPGPDAIAAHLRKAAPSMDERDRNLVLHAAAWLWDLAGHDREAASAYGMVLDSEHSFVPNVLALSRFLKVRGQTDKAAAVLEQTSDASFVYLARMMQDADPLQYAEIIEKYGFHGPSLAAVALHGDGGPEYLEQVARHLHDDEAQAAFLVAASRFHREAGNLQDAVRCALEAVDLGFYSSIAWAQGETAAGLMGLEPWIDFLEKRAGEGDPVFAVEAGILTEREFADHGRALRILLSLPHVPPELEWRVVDLALASGDWDTVFRFGRGGVRSLAAALTQTPMDPESLEEAVHLWGAGLLDHSVPESFVPEKSRQLFEFIGVLDKYRTSGELLPAPETNLPEQVLYEHWRTLWTEPAALLGSIPHKWKEPWYFTLVRDRLFLARHFSDRDAEKELLDILWNNGQDPFSTLWAVESAAESGDAEAYFRWLSRAMDVVDGISPDLFFMERIMSMLEYGRTGEAVAVLLEENMLEEAEIVARAYGEGLQKVLEMRDEPAYLLERLFRTLARDPLEALALIMNMDGDPVSAYLGMHIARERGRSQEYGELAERLSALVSDPVPVLMTAAAHLIRIGSAPLEMTEAISHDPEGAWLHHFLLQHEGEEGIHDRLEVRHPWEELEIGIRARITESEPPDSEQFGNVARLIRRIRALSEGRIEEWLETLDEPDRAALHRYLAEPTEDTGSALPPVLRVLLLPRTVDPDLIPVMGVRRYLSELQGRWNRLKELHARGLPAALASVRGWKSVDSPGEEGIQAVLAAAVMLPEGHDARRELLHLALEWGAASVEVMWTLFREFDDTSVLPAALELTEPLSTARYKLLQAWWESGVAMDAEVRYELASLEEGLGQLQRARDVWESLIAEDEFMEEALYRLAAIEHKLREGDPEGRLWELLDSERFSSSHLNAARALVFTVAFGKNRDIPRAVEIYEELAERFGVHELGVLGIAVHAAAGNMDRADELASQLGLPVRDTEDDDATPLPPPRGLVTGLGLPLKRHPALMTTEWIPDRFGSIAPLQTVHQPLNTLEHSSYDARAGEFPDTDAVSPDLLQWMREDASLIEDVAETAGRSDWLEDAGILRWITDGDIPEDISEPSMAFIALGEAVRSMDYSLAVQCLHKLQDAPYAMEIIGELSFLMDEKPTSSSLWYEDTYLDYLVRSGRDPADGLSYLPEGRLLLARITETSSVPKAMSLYRSLLNELPEARGYILFRMAVLSKDPADTLRSLAEEYPRPWLYAVMDGPVQADTDHPALIFGAGADTEPETVTGHLEPTLAACILVERSLRTGEEHEEEIASLGLPHAAHALRNLRLSAMERSDRTAALLSDTDSPLVRVLLGETPAPGSSEDIRFLWVLHARRHGEDIPWTGGDMWSRVLAARDLAAGLFSEVDEPWIWRVHAILSHDRDRTLRALMDEDSYPAAYWALLMGEDRGSDLSGTVLWAVSREKEDPAVWLDTMSYVDKSHGEWLLRRAAYLQEVTGSEPDTSITDLLPDAERSELMWRWSRRIGTLEPRRPRTDDPGEKLLYAIHKAITGEREPGLLPVERSSVAERMRRRWAYMSGMWTMATQHIVEALESPVLTDQEKAMLHEELALLDGELRGDTETEGFIRDLISELNCVDYLNDVYLARQGSTDAVVRLVRSLGGEVAYWFGCEAVRRGASGVEELVGSDFATETEMGWRRYLAGDVALPETWWKRSGGRQAIAFWAQYAGLLIAGGRGDRVPEIDNYPDPLGELLLHRALRERTPSRILAKLGQVMGPDAYKLAGMAAFHWELDNTAASEYLFTAFDASPSDDAVFAHLWDLISDDEETSLVVARRRLRVEPDEEVKNHLLHRAISSAMNLEEYDTALRLAAQYVQRGDTTWGLAMQAEAALGAGDRETARQAIERLLDLVSPSGDQEIETRTTIQWLILLGELRRELNEPSVALEAFVKALHLGGSDRKFLNNLHELAMSLDRCRDAVDAGERMLRTSTTPAEEAESWLKIGQAFEACRKPDRAKEAYDRALEAPAPHVIEQVLGFYDRQNDQMTRRIVLDKLVFRATRELASSRPEVVERLAYLFSLKGSASAAWLRAAHASLTGSPRDVKPIPAGKVLKSIENLLPEEIPRSVAIFAKAFAPYLYPLMPRHTDGDTPKLPDSLASLGVVPLLVRGSRWQLEPGVTPCITVPENTNQDQSLPFLLAGPLLLHHHGLALLAAPADVLLPVWNGLHAVMLKNRDLEGEVDESAARKVLKSLGNDTASLAGHLAEAGIPHRADIDRMRTHLHAFMGILSLLATGSFSQAMDILREDELDVLLSFLASKRFLQYIEN